MALIGARVVLSQVQSNHSRKRGRNDINEVPLKPEMLKKREQNMRDAENMKYDFLFSPMSL